MGNGNARHAGVSTKASSLIAGALHSDIGTKSFMATKSAAGGWRSPGRRKRAEIVCTVANSSPGRIRGFPARWSSLA